MFGLWLKAWQLEFFSDANGDAELCWLWAAALNGWTVLCCSDGAKIQNQA